MSAKIEQRAHERVPVSIEVTLESEHNFYTGLTSDISEGGLFVATHVAPALGEKLELDLVLPGGAATFRVRGVVRWVRELRVACDGVPPGFGMQWVALPKEAADSIQRFVVERDSIFFEAA